MSIGDGSSLSDEELLSEHCYDNTGDLKLGEYIEHVESFFIPLDLAVQQLKLHA